ncbi:O-antigen ligase family protein [Alteromonas gilva]|uniref:O-antigen ligase family protein n=1 Tax=Alteromonas gilva TaxID=2987522 RepID=A0ABT5KXR2_9ALTE|nr:O-antigen ligase family protein [Alteromonas gilva]MDC8829563.1 O-antigen ligase family protein [Alteromonas gilva]
MCRTDKRIKQVMLCIIFSGLFQALYGALEVLLAGNSSWIFGLPVKNVATGTFVYKNHFANYLMLCLSIGVGYLVSTLNTQTASTKREHIRNFLNTMLNGKAVVRIALAIMVIALVMSRSRMGNTAFFASMTILGLLGLLLIKHRSRGLTMLIVSLFVIDTFILSAWFGLDKVQERLEQTSLEQEKRDEVVRDSLPLLSDFSSTGSGMGTYYNVFTNYQGEDIYAFYDHAHNDYLQFAIEGGIPATILIALLPLWAFIEGIKALRERRNGLMQGLAFGGCMAILGMFIHISVDFPLQAPANAMLFVIIIALAFCSKKRERRRRSRQALN